jgi:hypothetical protein
LWFSEGTTNHRSLKAYRLIGILFAMAISNGNILDFPFPAVLYRRITRLSARRPDLQEFDPVLAQGFQNILAYDGSVEADMGVFFTYDGHPLCENGQTTPVTNENREAYYDKVVEYLLVTSVRDQFESLRNGFLQAFDQTVLKIFRPKELAMLVNGIEELDFVALGRAATYEGYSSDSPTVLTFWKIVHGRLTSEEKQLLVSFITSCPALHPKDWVQSLS